MSNARFFLSLFESSSRWNFHACDEDSLVEFDLGERPSHPPAHEVAAQYAQAYGMASPRLTRNQPLPHRLMQDLGDAFEDTPHSPHDPQVVAQYQAFFREIVAQAKWILATGLQVEPWMKGGEPYASSKDMVVDIAQNNHLYFLRSAGGFGGSQAGGEMTLTDNLMLQPSGLKVGGYAMDFNEVTRWVHDYFGHAAEGNQFGPRGEYNAFLKHSQLFSQMAQKPLIAELLMQAGWFFGGRHIRRPDRSIPAKGDPDYVHPSKRSFIDPKNLLPSDELAQRVKAMHRTF